MRLGIIGTVGVPARYGGFETLVHQLILNMGNRHEITVYASSKAYQKEERIKKWNGAKIKYIPLKANGPQSILYDILSIIHALIFCDVLLILGVSGCMILPFVKLFSRKRVIVNIDGLEWRRPKWNWLAKRFLLWSEIMACRFADEIVTDNRILKEYAQIRYNINTRLIEYGADHTKKVEIKKEDVRKYGFLAGNYAFKVARIEPENNIHLILSAFAQMPGQKLVLVGNWDNSNYGRKLKEKYRAVSNLFLLDPIYESRELNLIRSNATLYIHGHSAGGTNPSLVEAMYLGLPVLSIDAIYNRITTHNQALFFNNEKELCERVLETTFDRYDLEALCYNLQQIAFNQYTWKRVTHMYCQAIEGLQQSDIAQPKLRKIQKKIALGQAVPLS